MSSGYLTYPFSVLPVNIKFLEKVIVSASGIISLNGLIISEVNKTRFCSLLADGWFLVGLWVVFPISSYLSSHNI